MTDNELEQEAEKLWKARGTWAMERLAQITGHIAEDSEIKMSDTEMIELRAKIEYRIYQMLAAEYK